jgi:hypothetical protein
VIEAKEDRRESFAIERLGVADDTFLVLLE